GRGRSGALSRQDGRPLPPDVPPGAGAAAPVLAPWPRGGSRNEPGSGTSPMNVQSSTGHDDPVQASAPEHAKSICTSYGSGLPSSPVRSHQTNFGGPPLASNTLPVIVWSSGL